MRVMGDAVDDDEIGFVDVGPQPVLAIQRLAKRRLRGGETETSCRGRAGRPCARSRNRARRRRRRRSAGMAAVEVDRLLRPYGVRGGVCHWRPSGWFDAETYAVTGDDDSRGR